MDYRPLGRSDLKVSTAGLGCNNFGGRIGMDQSRQVIWKALDLGVTLFDTAPSYGDDNGSEIALGDFLGKHRQDIVLATKFGADRRNDKMVLTGSSRADIMQAVDGSLKRLKTDWIDVYQEHRRDPNTPVEEILETLAELVKAGKIRYAGISQPTAELLDEWNSAGKERGLPGLAAVIHEYNLLNREADTDLMPRMREQGLGFLPYFPLAGGMLTGKYRNGTMPEGARLTENPGLAKHFMTAEGIEKTEQLAALADRCGTSLVSVAISWLLTRAPVASVIAGATTPEQIEANVEAGAFLFTDADLAEIEAITG